MVPSQPDHLPQVGFRPVWQRTVDAVVTFGLAAAVVGAPLAFGAVHQWAVTALATLMIVAAGAWAVQSLLCAVSSHTSGRRPERLRTGAYGWIGVTLGAWLAASLVPLPPSLIGRAGPENYRVLQLALPGWPATSDYEDIPGGSSPSLCQGRWRPLALSPFLTRAALLRVFGYCITFLIVAYYPWGSGKGAMTWCALGLLLVAWLEAAYALWQSAVGGGAILWYRKPPESTYWAASGTYINRNHFAGLLEMAMPVAVGLVLQEGQRLAVACELHGGSATLGMRIHRIARAAAGPGVFRFSVYTSIALLLAVALYRSFSRAGLLCPLAAACLLSPFLWGAGNSAPRPARDSRLASFRPYLPALGLVFLIFAVDLPELAPRFSDVELAGGAAGRAAAMRDALRMLAAFPIFGVGLGNFEATYPAYRSFGGGHLAHVHNDFIEFAVETGLPGAALALLLIAGMYRRGCSALRRQGEGRYLLWGGLVGVTALLLHGLVDFNLQIPANALVFASLTGMVVRLSATPRVLPAEVRRATVPRWFGPLASLVCLTIIAGTELPRAWAETEFRRLYPDSSLTLAASSPGRTAAEAAISRLRALEVRASGSPFVHYALGLELERLAAERLRAGKPARAPAREAVQHFARAARIIPQWASPHFHIGVLAATGLAGLRGTDAEGALARAEQLDPYNPVLAREIRRIRVLRYSGGSS